MVRSPLHCLLGFLALAACAHPAAPSRPLVVEAGGRWLGHGISYGPHRDGQRPGGPAPTRAELAEDLALLAPRWSLLRLYSSDATAEQVLTLIRERRLPLKVLLGAWIAREVEPGPDGAAGTPVPGAQAANREQVEAAVRLGNAYPDVVLGLCVGNETQVSWSAHRLPAATLIGWLRAARAGTSLPVATADDFGFWLQPGSEEVAREADFLVTHIYAMWNGQPLEGALAFTRSRFAEVAARHPGKPLVLGEAGWATRKHTQGDQATLIKAPPGEGPQRDFYRAFTAWVLEEHIVSTWFEAFDEGWKGGPHPDEVEKHWGLFNVDRTPKEALRAP
jgi:exo-beta-1,3-glucanase (GH17 family)